MEGEGRGAVPEAFLHDLGVDALSQEQRNMAMAQVMEADPGQPCPFEGTWSGDLAARARRRSAPPVYSSARLGRGAAICAGRLIAIS